MWWTGENWSAKTCDAAVTLSSPTPTYEHPSFLLAGCPSCRPTNSVLGTEGKSITFQLHWLSVPERVTFKLCIMVYRCLHGIGPEYFSEDFRLVSEIYSRQRLRSASSTNVVVPATRRSSLGNRALPVAGARAWNALPASVISAPSLSSFRRLLKTFLFQRQRRQ